MLFGLLLAGTAALPGARVELPAGPAADLATRLGPETRPAELPLLGKDPWAQGATWKRWSQLLVQEAPAKEPDPARRAELALLALEQGRYDDAWERFTECASSPSVAAALLPRLLPGTDLARLEDGAVLAPALPPLSSKEARAAGSLRGGVDRRSMRIDGLAVGSAVIAIRVAVEVEGVQIDVAHLSGGPVKLSIAIPKDPRFGFSDEYVDWYRAEAKGISHAISIQPGDEEHTLYARFEPRASEWPTLLPERVPAQIESGGLLLEARAGGADLELLRAVAASLSDGPLRLPAAVRDSQRPPEAFTGITIDLSDPANRSRKLAWIAGAVERRSLARPR